MIDRLFWYMQAFVMVLFGKADDLHESLNKNYKEKLGQAVLLRAAVRQDTVTKKERKDLARLEKELEEIELRQVYVLARNPRVSQSDAEEAEAIFKFVAQLPIVLFWLVTNASLLFLLCYFAHIPVMVTLFVIPTTLFFLGWIWFTERNSFLRRAGSHWREMVEDAGKLLSKSNGKGKK